MCRWLNENPHAEAVYKQRASRGCKSLKSLQLYKENPAGSNLHDYRWRCGGQCTGWPGARSQEGHTFQQKGPQKNRSSRIMWRSDSHQPSEGRNDQNAKGSCRKADTGHSRPSERQRRRRAPRNAATHWPSQRHRAGLGKRWKAATQRQQWEKKNATLINAKAVNKQLWQGQRGSKDKPDLCCKTQITACKMLLLFAPTEETRLE